MEPAQYEIPLVVWPPRRRPWQRLYLTPTHSSAAHAKTHGNPHNHAHEEERARDSLEWTLRAEYDHEKDLFRDKPATLRRSGFKRGGCEASGGASEDTGFLGHLAAVHTSPYTYPHDAKGCPGLRQEPERCLLHLVAPPSSLVTGA
ncbi:uncharacterized protein LOC121871199 isoform X2 [Homarus americanus]|nr:uncharacterized protein LOC121871199 isoform X2 [Homarus americanus]